MARANGRVIRWVVLAGCAGLGACSGKEGNEPAEIGGTTSSSGGIPSGGAATGGTGAATGGTLTGGSTALGGIPSGGMATGGAQVGGATTGGVATGGTATGGIPIGGTSSGGGATGGAGAPTGGAGAPTGGAGAPTGGFGTGATGDGGLSSGGVSSGGDGGSGAASGGTGGGGDGPCPGSGTLTPGDTRMSLTVEGNEYPFIVHAPPSYDGVTRLPVVFDFHGLGGDENQMIRFSGWASTGDAEGFITVFPGGIDNAWNAGLCCSDTPTDVAFVRAVIDTLESEACIDTKRVYASGCSNGGGMSFRLACEAADVIAGVAPVDFDCVLGAGCGQCSPSRPITVVQFRGTSDTAVPYDGSGAFSGAQANFATWGEINQCTGSPGPLSQSPSCETYPACGAGVETILCTVQNGTHCGSYSSFDIAELAWGVLRNHALP